MSLLFAYRRYALPFRAPVRTAHGPWAVREGLIVRTENEAGTIGFGEIAPVPWFGTETVDEATAALRSLGGRIDETQIAALPVRLNCTCHGLRSALADVGQLGELAPLADENTLGQRPGLQLDAPNPAAPEMSPELESGSHVAAVHDRRTGSGQFSDVGAHLACAHHAGISSGRRQAAPLQNTVGARRDSTESESLSLPIAALLPAGREALAAVAGKTELVFRVFKWKVGVGDNDEELGLLDDLLARLPGGARLRLDANGAWDRRRAERWLERCAERPIEFVEQPIAPSARGTDDLLLGLEGDFPTPLALDESLVHDGDVERWLAADWPGLFVVKPALLGDPTAVCAQLASAKAQVVFSSALETAVGAQSALRLAFAWPGEQYALGFGVYSLFADARFDGPVAAPFVSVTDVNQLNPEAVWNALS